MNTKTKESINTVASWPNKCCEFRVNVLNPWWCVNPNSCCGLNMQVILISQQNNRKTLHSIHCYVYWKPISVTGWGLKYKLFQVCDEHSWKLNQMASRIWFICNKYLAINKPKMRLRYTVTSDRSKFCLPIYLAAMYEH